MSFFFFLSHAQILKTSNVTKICVNIQQNVFELFYTFLVSYISYVVLTCPHRNGNVRCHKNERKDIKSKLLTGSVKRVIFLSEKNSSGIHLRTIKLIKKKMVCTSSQYNCKTTKSPSSFSSLAPLLPPPPPLLHPSSASSPPRLRESEKWWPALGRRSSSAVTN